MTLATEEIMQALWLEDGALSYRADVPVPRVGEHEALVRVVRAGICNTDLEMVRGYYPFAGVPGHEFVGIVEQGPDRLLGHRVVGEINISCGDCGSCRQGLETHCDNREVLGIRGRNGAFAEYLSLPSDNLHSVSDTLSLDAATFTEPLAAALQIQQQRPVGPDDRVLVVGPGKLGQLIAQTLCLTGCQLHLVGRRRGQISLPGARQLEIVLAEDLPPRSFDMVVECTGNADGFRIARGGVRPRGVLVLKSTYAGRLDFDASALVVDEVTLLGSRCGPLVQALELLEANRVEVEPLIEARFPLSEGILAFERAQEPGALKVLLEMAEISDQEC